MVEYKENKKKMKTIFPHFYYRRAIDFADLRAGAAYIQEEEVALIFRFCIFLYVII